MGAFKIDAGACAKLVFYEQAWGASRGPGWCGGHRALLAAIPHLVIPAQAGIWLALDN
jgi:hypothetical protein